MFVPLEKYLIVAIDWYYLHMKKWPFVHIWASNGNSVSADPGKASILLHLFSIYKLWNGFKYIKKGLYENYLGGEGGQQHPLLIME